MTLNKRKGVLFVCLGNTCRSPIAEAVFADSVKKRGLTDQWFVDSAGTAGYHVGKLPNPRARTTMDRHRVEYNHVARVLTTEDFDKFDFILGMDYYNVQDIEEIAPKGSKATIEMFGIYDPVDKSTFHDPYCDRDSKGFDICYQRCLRCIKVFLDKYSGNCDSKN